jgi:hypothetical protein
MAEDYLDQFASPASKLVRFFEKSRNGWKAKHHELKKTCKLLQNQARTVEESRKSWRKRALQADQRVAELERQIEQLKCRH